MTEEPYVMVTLTGVGINVRSNLDHLRATGLLHDGISALWQSAIAGVGSVGRPPQDVAAPAGATVRAPGITARQVA